VDLVVADFLKFGTVHAKIGIIPKKLVLFIRNLMKKSDSVKSDFFQPAKFLNTA
jgi:hypothetical protein